MSQITSGPPPKKKNTKKQIFLGRAFQIEHNTAWAALVRLSVTEEYIPWAALCGAAVAKELKEAQNLNKL